jgi:hypothetical protein
VVNHEALAIRREPRMVQARIGSTPPYPLANDCAEKFCFVRQNEQLAASQS